MGRKIITHCDGWDFTAPTAQYGHADGIDDGEEGHQDVAVDVIPIVEVVGVVIQVKDTETFTLPTK